MATLCQHQVNGNERVNTVVELMNNSKKMTEYSRIKGGFSALSLFRATEYQGRGRLPKSEAECLLMEVEELEKQKKKNKYCIIFTFGSVGILTGW